MVGDRVLVFCLRTYLCKSSRYFFNISHYFGERFLIDVSSVFKDLGVRGWQIILVFLEIGEWADIIVLAVIKIYILCLFFELA